MNTVSATSILLDDNNEPQRFIWYKLNTVNFHTQDNRPNNNNNTQPEA